MHRRKSTVKPQSDEKSDTSVRSNNIIQLCLVRGTKLTEKCYLLCLDFQMLGRIGHGDANLVRGIAGLPAEQRQPKCQNFQSPPGDAHFGLDIKILCLHERKKWPTTYSRLLEVGR